MTVILKNIVEMDMQIICSDSQQKLVVKTNVLFGGQRREWHRNLFEFGRSLKFEVIEKGCQLHNMGIVFRAQKMCIFIFTEICKSACGMKFWQYPLERCERKREG